MRPSLNRERVYKGLPIREARASLHVQPNARDIAGATKESPDNCAYARCLKRTLETPNVFVFKTVAYVGTRDENGEYIMERYTVKSYAREYLLRFDGGEKVEPGGFVFHKPNKSNTLSYKAKEQYRRWKAGKVSPRLTKTGKVQPKNYSMRSGKGKCHFFGSEDQIKV